MTTVDEFAVTFVGSKMIKTDLLSDLLFKGIGEGGGWQGGGGQKWVCAPPPNFGHSQCSNFTISTISYLACAFTPFFSFHFSGKKLVSRLPKLFGAELRHCYLFSDEQYQEFCTIYIRPNCEALDYILG